MEYTDLPDKFIDKMKQLLGADEFGAYIDSFKKPAFHGMRFNTLKLDMEKISLIQSEGAYFKNKGNLRSVPWISNGFYYDEDEGFKPARHPYYFAGLYYLQEPSAMTPANLLPISPGDRVLDLCAAPGGKSTELAARLKGDGFLLSNDISNSRAKALLKNLELFGVGNCCVSSEMPEKLALYFESFFDKILIDAPCSGEGMFRRDKDMVKSWQEKGPAYYSRIQKEIAKEAVKMLKPGGKLLYSTCTFDEEEDEGTIRYILETCSDMRLIKLELKKGFMPGKGLDGCVRLFPHKLDGEGHFIALLEKKCEDRAECETTQGIIPADGPDSFASLKKEERESLDSFFSHIDRGLDKKRVYVKNDCVYYLPEALLGNDRNRLLKLRYLRTGLLLGELKKGRFEPSQALAMNLKMEEFDDTINFPCEDERVIRYLKGETIPLSAEEAKGKSGWCLVGVDGFPLGFAKRTGTMLKNKYYPGWRWQ